MDLVAERKADVVRYMNSLDLHSNYLLEEVLLCCEHFGKSEDADVRIRNICNHHFPSLKGEIDATPIRLCVEALLAKRKVFQWCEKIPDEDE